MSSADGLALHSWNRAFSWKSRSGPYRCISDAQARSYDEDGFFLLEDAFDAETVSRVIDEIDPWEARVEKYLRDRHGGRASIARADEITFTTHLVLRSARLREFCSGGVFPDLVHDLLGPDVRLYWDQAVYKKPNPSEFPWHQDNGYTFIEPQHYLTCWVALADTDESNGCPWVVPGAQRRGTLAHAWTDLGWRCLQDPPDATAVPVRAGSIVVFSSLTPHRTGPNLTDDVRKAYIVQFAPDGAQCVTRVESEIRHIPQNNPDRQFPILRRGRLPSS